MLTNEQAIEILHEVRLHDSVSTEMAAKLAPVINFLEREQSPAEQPIPINLSVIPSGAKEDGESGTYVTGYCTSILYSNGFVLRHITGEEKWEKLPLIPQD